MCRLNLASGGEIVCEWPKRCKLWSDSRIVDLTSMPGGFATIASSVVGWHRFIGDQVVYLKKQIEIWSSDPAIVAAFKPYQNDDSAEGKLFVDCCGRFARESAHYPKAFAQAF